ncbi:MAG: hypothetical protein U0326_21640 [Polyangiales bacterium]
MEPKSPEEEEDRTLARYEVVVWLLAGASTAAHLYTVLRARSIIGSVDTLAAMLVAVTLVVVMRWLRARRP